jgi:hypothetical protein
MRSEIKGKASLGIVMIMLLCVVQQRNATNSENHFEECIFFSSPSESKTLTSHCRCPVTYGLAKPIDGL